MEPTKEELDLIIELLQNFIMHQPDFKNRHKFDQWFKISKLPQLGYSWTAGSTKYCIFHKDLKNWILKTDPEYDYMKMEYNNYLLSYGKGLEQYFPNTIYLGKFNEQEYYIQQKADVDSMRVENEWLKKQFNLGYRYHRDEMHNIPSYETTMILFNDPKLASFIEERKIADYSGTNFGYINDQLVIIDFSGRI